MTKQLSLLTAILVFLFAACNKEELITEFTDVRESEDLMKMERIYDDVDYEVDYRMEEKSGKFDESKDDDCPTLTWSAPPGVFPNTLIIDFGDVGCVSASGSVKTGQIVVNQNAPMHEPGAIRTITFVDLTIDSVGVAGTVSLENNGPQGPGQRSFTRTLVGGELTFPDGTVATRNATRTLTQLDGLGTPTFIDDIFAITGQGGGVNRNGVPYSTTIIEPLIKERNCHWIIQGVKEMTYGPHFRSIDFGHGFCYPFATVTNGNGQSVVITMHP